MKPYRSMKTFARVSSPLRLTVALLLLVAFGIAPAAADNDRKRDRGQGHGSDQRHEHNNNRFSDGYRQREWRGEDRSYGYRPVYPQPYLYSQPVYVPPPVYYAPRQSPGISLFFPLDLR